jgi:hypothetical protein
MSKYFCILVFILASCNTRHENDKPLIKENKTQEHFITAGNCFNSQDTVNTGEARACGNWFYKKVDSQHIIGLYFSGAEMYDTCREFIIDSNNVKLFVYNHNDASLFAYCNDYGANNVSKTITNASGRYFIKLYKPTEWRGTDKPTASIFIPEINFTDSLKTISFKNIFYWKTVQWGPAG